MLMLSRVSPSRVSNSPIPVCAGIGLKPQHIPEILELQADTGWFEVHPENYLMDGGPMHKALTAIRERYPLSFHSVGMSLGSAGGIDRAYILKLKDLCERY